MEHARRNTHGPLKRARFAISAALACIGLGPGVAAQEIEEPSLEDMVELLVVTARKREDSIQEVPLSVSAITATQIEEQGLHDLQDISQATPGLVYENYATAGLSTAAVTRGMGQTFTSARIQNTAVFLDGIYLQRQSMVNPSLLDMERVEIVKGPQNAQFGRNAFAGAIQYVTKRPPSEPSANLVLGYGSGDRFDRRFEAGGPLAGGRFAARVFASASDFDGHTDNNHPFADSGPGGKDATDGMLGGWQDEAYSAAFRWTPGDQFTADVAYHYNGTVREPQAYYDLNGARYAYDTAEFGPPPFFAFLAPTSTNCLNTTTFSDRLPFPARGMHAWCGELPTSPPVVDDPKLAAAGHADSRGAIAVDPRSLALDATTHVGRIELDYVFDERLSVNYQFGYVDHRADTLGTTEGRASLVGSAVPYVPVRGLSVPPFIEALGPPGSFGAVVQTSLFYANPLEQLDAVSHELRLTWQREDLVARAGFYASENDDEDRGTWRSLPPCDGVHCSLPATVADSVLDGRYIAVVPVVPGQLNVGVPHFLDTGHGLLADHTTYRDAVRALFGDVEWLVREDLTVAVEARITRESKSFAQLTTTFGADLPDNVNASDDETFTFFTPRVIMSWTPSDASMFYALAARGVKTGGFNAVDPAQNPDQATYDEETNLTVEFGAKNQLLDGRLILNAAVYAIDWRDVQGTEAASGADAWTRDVVGNIGDAEVIGFELQGVWRPTERFFVDYGLAYNDAKYKSGVYVSSMAGPNSSWGCDDTVCRADGRVDGKRIERTSKMQYNVGFNYAQPVGASANAAFRVDFNFRDSMFATPLNLAHNGDRTLANASFKVQGEKWQATLWARNILDEEYVANSFVLASFNRYIVGLGARRTVGLTVKVGF